MEDEPRIYSQSPIDALLNCKKREVFCPNCNYRIVTNIPGPICGNCGSNLITVIVTKNVELAE